MFKTQYTEEEANELLRWIDTHPSGELDLGEGIYIRDIALFTSQMRAIVQIRYKKTAFAGQLEILSRLKEAYEARAREQAQ